MKKVLVLGGTGMLGAPAARQILAAGIEVRILTRVAEKARKTLGSEFDIVNGDVADIQSLEQAMQGCDGAHISVGGAVDRVSAENVAALAARLGFGRIGYVSGSTVCEGNRWFPMVEQKLLAEQAVIDSGVPFTIFRPTWPMEQLPRFVMGGRATVIGDRLEPWHWFAAEDMGTMVSKAFQLEEAAGKHLFIHGPEALSAQAALERYCKAFHPDIGLVFVMPIEVARATAETTGNTMLKMFAEMMAYFKKVGEPGDPTEANKLLGAPATTLDAWIENRKTKTA
jgi:uncharacterized protein YbjT (DUF2867 family)